VDAERDSAPVTSATGIELTRHPELFNHGSP
jgi:hypothetical protein